MSNNTKVTELQETELDKANGGWSRVEAQVSDFKAKAPKGIVLGQDGNDLLIVNNGDGSDFLEGGAGNDF